MIENWSETWNEEMRRRCGVVDITEKVREARLRCYGHAIRRDEGVLVRDIMSRDGIAASRNSRRPGGLRNGFQTENILRFSQVLCLKCKILYCKVFNPTLGNSIFLPMSTSMLFC